jgi:hypothetical protein
MPAKERALPAAMLGASVSGGLSSDWQPCSSSQSLDAEKPASSSIYDVEWSLLKVAFADIIGQEAKGFTSALTLLLI